MTQFAELVGRNSDAWREYVESLVTTDSAAFETRLDELEQQTNDRGWYVAGGKEIEFSVAAPPGRVPPGRYEFYAAYVKRMCGDVPPPVVAKGGIVDPRLTGAPILVSKRRDGTYLWDRPDEPDSSVMETATMPSISWRERNRRYWNAISTLGELAAEYRCRVKIRGTHSSTSVAWLDAEGNLEPESNFEGDGDMLVAMQGVRQALQPLEPYTSLLPGRGETYPSKAVLWAVFDIRTETRPPVFGIVDGRLDELGALAGVNQELAKELPRDRSVLHQCRKLDIWKEYFPELDVLSTVLVWDDTIGKMVLPEVMTRGSIGSAIGHEAPFGLDMIVAMLTSSTKADFSADNARVLREAVQALTLTSEDKITVDSTSPYGRFWKHILEYAHISTSPAVRIALPPQAESEGYVPDRKRALASPDVAAILGPELLRAITDPAKAYALRALRLNTRTT